MLTLFDPLKLRLARLTKYKVKTIQPLCHTVPLISVYVPTYNRAELLMERAIPSVLNQTHTNFEFIILGDCCTDKTEQYVKSIRDKRIRFYNLPTRGYRYPPTAENHWLAGPVVAANKALEMTKGTYIARIDDDDLWTEDHLARLLNYLEFNHYEFVSAALETERYGKKAKVGAENGIGGTQTWLYCAYLKFFKYNINCWKKKWDRPNDIDLQERMRKAGVKMGYLDRIVARIIPRPGEETIGLDAYKATAEEKCKWLE